MKNFFSNSMLGKCVQIMRIIDVSLETCKIHSSYLCGFFFQAKYGSHWCTVLNSSRVCKYCAIRRPALLGEQAFSVILKDPELLKKTCSTLSHLPLRLSCLIGHAINTHSLEEAAQLVEFVHEDKSQLSWFCADSSHSIVKLLRFRFCCKVY